MPDAIVYSKGTFIGPSVIVEHEHLVEIKRRQDEWRRQRNEAIAKQHQRQRAQAEARLMTLNAQIARVEQALATETASDADKAAEVLAKLVAKRDQVATKIEAMPV